MSATHNHTLRPGRVAHLEGSSTSDELVAPGSLVGLVIELASLSTVR